MYEFGLKIGNKCGVFLLGGGFLRVNGWTGNERSAKEDCTVRFYDIVSY